MALLGWMHAPAGAAHMLWHHTIKEVATLMVLVCLSVPQFEDEDEDEYYDGNDDEDALYDLPIGGESHAHGGA